MMGLASLLLHEGDLDGAAMQYEQLMRIYQMQTNFDPKLGAAGEMVVAAQLIKRGDKAGAIAALQQARKWDPLNPRVVELLARFMASTNQYLPQMPHLELRNRRGVLRLALVCLTLLAHGSVCTHDFVNMDDPQTIYDNPLLRPPSFTNTLYYWSNRGLELYIPCTYTVWCATAAISAGWRGSEYILRPIGFSSC